MLAIKEQFILRVNIAIRTLRTSTVRLTSMKLRSGGDLMLINRTLLPQESHVRTFGRARLPKPRFTTTFS